MPGLLRLKHAHLQQEAADDKVRRGGPAAASVLGCGSDTPNKKTVQAPPRPPQPGVSAMPAA